MKAARLLQMIRILQKLSPKGWRCYNARQMAQNSILYDSPRGINEVNSELNKKSNMNEKSNNEIENLEKKAEIRIEFTK